MNSAVATQLANEQKPLQHVAIIMDGNGRWAQQKGLTVGQGHEAGALALKKIVLHALNHQLSFLSVFCFSTENWKRSSDEVKALMSLFKKMLTDEKEIEFFSHKGVRLNFLGHINLLPAPLGFLANKIKAKTIHNSRLQVNLAINYGGRDDIIQATKEICKDVLKNKLSLEDISETMFENYLFTKNMPDPDLVIRTSGEQRISNFLIYQSAYAEFFFSDVLWPDFDEKEFDKAIEDFHHRQRRFGVR